MRNVRWRDDTASFEGKCETCSEWLPIDLEFWNKRWLTRCKVCTRAYHRMSEATRRTVKHEALLARRRELRAINYAQHRAREQRYRETHREHTNAWAREWRARNREHINEQARRYYWENREALLMKGKMRRLGIMEKAA